MDVVGVRVLTSKCTPVGEPTCTKRHTFALPKAVDDVVSHCCCLWMHTMGAAWIATPRPRRRPAAPHVVAACPCGSRALSTHVAPSRAEPADCDAARRPAASGHEERAHAGAAVRAALAPAPHARTHTPAAPDIVPSTHSFVSGETLEQITSFFETSQPAQLALTDT